MVKLFLKNTYNTMKKASLIGSRKLHNPQAAPNIQEFHTLRPIPQDQIDRTEGEFSQNQGY